LTVVLIRAAEEDTEEDTEGGEECQWEEEGLPEEL
jgi:hypothetical protein